jgi:hypothetical protein
MTRYKFKQDNEGYLDNRKTHIYLFDLATKKLDTLTSGNYNEGDVAISADDSMIAYASNVSENPDKNSNSDIFLLKLTKGATPLQLITVQYLVLIILKLHFYNLVLKEIMTCMILHNLVYMTLSQILQ